MQEKGKKEGGEEEGRRGLFITTQQLHAQRDAPMPLPREDANISGVDRRIEDVLLVDVIVAVSRKNLKEENG